MSRRHVSLLLCLAGGCAQTPETPAPALDEPPELDGACPSLGSRATAEGYRVLVCEALFDDAPRVRPPPDEASGDELTLYAGVSKFTYHWLSGDTRAGEHYELLDEQGAPVGPTSSGLPEGLLMPSNRNLYTLYRLRGTRVGTTQLRLHDATPVLVFGDGVIEGALLGAWEGEASRRVGEGAYDREVPVRFRVTFGVTEAMPPVRAWEWDSALSEYGAVALLGEIDTWTKPRRSADGACLAPLSALGDEHPFFGATSGTLRLYRLAGMHLEGDEQQILDYPPGASELSGNGMDGLRYMSPGGLLREAGGDVEIDFFPHSTPNGHHVRIFPVQGGGDDC
jgi:hypothetical protein